MYNGIGLATPRGSGTNGYVQRNLALSYKTKDKGNFKAPNEIATPSLKKPNTDIIEHDRKRKIEVKCLEFQSMLEDQGFVNYKALIYSIENRLPQD